MFMYFGKALSDLSCFEKNMNEINNKNINTPTLLEKEFVEYKLPTEP